MCIVEVFFVIDTRTVNFATDTQLKTYWSVVSLNWISESSAVVFVCEGTKIGPRGASKSVDFGGGSLYLMGAGALIFLLCFLGADFGSGVALALVSGARDPPFDSRFLSDSFFALDARSRASGASSCFGALKSGFRGEDTAG
jgi:hypothetical protein